MSARGRKHEHRPPMPAEHRLWAGLMVAGEVAWLLVLLSAGLLPGEPLVRLAEVEAVDVRRETLDMLCISEMEDGRYGANEVAREGFPGMGPADFIVRFFIEAQGMWWTDTVTRIEWRYVEEDR